MSVFHFSDFQKNAGFPPETAFGSIPYLFCLLSSRNHLMMTPQTTKNLGFGCVRGQLLHFQQDGPCKSQVAVAGIQ